MTTPFSSTARPASFAPRKGPMNKREQFLNHVFGNGWMPDTTRQVRSGDGLVQDPHAFVRESQTGPDWKLRLDFTDANGYLSTKLRGVLLFREGEEKLRLLPQRDWSHNRVLWEVTGRDLEPGWREVALRPRAERLVEDPDLCAWLAAEQLWTEQVEFETREKARIREQKQRRKPPQGLAVERHVWDRRAEAVVSAARKLYRIDGLSDTAALMDDLRKAVAQLEESLS